MPSVRLPVRVFVVLALAGLLLVPLLVTRVTAVLLFVALVPGWAVATRARASLVPTLGLATAASPVMFGAVVLAAMLAGLPPVAAAWSAVCVGAVLYVVFGGARVTTNSAEVRIAWGLVAVAAVAAALALTLPLTNEWWRTREDSWFHAAVFTHIVQQGLPAVDPYFSPLRLQYVYFYHTILAGVAALSGLGPFRTMILVNAVALAGCVFGFQYLASFFSRRVGPRMWGGVFVLFAMNGLFYLFYPIRLARAFVGETSGAQVLRHFFPWSPPGHDTAARLLSIEGNQFLFLDKFMLGTALSLTFSLVCVVLGMLLSARRGKWSTAHAALYVLSIAGALYLHTVVGAVVAVATLFVLVLLIAIHSHPDDGGPTYPALVGLSLLGAALAAPYVYSVMPRGGGGGALRWAFQAGHAVGLVSDVLPAVLLSIPFLRWVGKRDEWRTRASVEEAEAEDSGLAPPPPHGVLMGRLFGELSLSGAGMTAVWLAVVLAVAFFADLPANNETKFSFLLFLPLAAYAVGGLDRWWDTRARRVAAVAFVVASTLPLNCVYFYQAFRDRSTVEVADDESATYRWIEQSTPVDAIFIDSGDIVRIPVLAARDLYWGTEAYARNWDYPATEVEWRRATRDSTFTAVGPTGPQIAALRALGHPVYILCRSIQGDGRAAFDALRENREFRGRFIAGGLAVFELTGAGDENATPGGP